MPQSSYTVANTFAGQSGNVPASQIDTDFAQPAAALNSLNTFGNYFVDAGAVNAIAITLPMGLTFSLAAGLWFDVQVVATNTSTAVTMAINGGAATPVIDNQGNTLAVSALLIGGVYRLVHDGTSFRVMGVVGGKGTFTPVWSGFTTTNLGDWTWVRSQNHASLYIAIAVSGTSNDISTSFSGIPSIVRPHATQIQPVVGITDNSVATTAPGIATISPAGTISFAKDNVNVWTNSGTKGFGGLSFTYPLL